MLLSENMAKLLGTVVTQHYATAENSRVVLMSHIQKSVYASCDEEVCGSGLDRAPQFARRTDGRSRLEQAMWQTVHGMGVSTVYGRTQESKQVSVLPETPRIAAGSDSSRRSATRVRQVWTVARPDSHPHLF